MQYLTYCYTLSSRLPVGIKKDRKDKRLKGRL